MPIGTACYLFEWSIGLAHIQKPLATLSVFCTISHSISSWYNICIYFSPFIFYFPFLLVAQIGRLWSERYQSQQWQFNIERRNHIDTVQWKSRWPCRSNESPFRRKWFADYDDNEKQSFNCGNGGTKRKYTHTQKIRTIHQAFETHSFRFQRFHFERGRKAHTKIFSHRLRNFSQHRWVWGFCARSFYSTTFLKNQ